MDRNYARSEVVEGLSHTHWLLIEQAQNQLPLSLLLILVFWLALLFVSFGLFSPPHVTAITVLFVGSCAVSAAIFLVLELNRPLDGHGSRRSRQRGRAVHVFSWLCAKLVAGRYHTQ